jgi:hypothetical protein
MKERVSGILLSLFEVIGLLLFLIGGIAENIQDYNLQIALDLDEYSDETLKESIKYYLKFISII